MKRLGIIVIAGFLLLYGTIAAALSVRGSKHDLSTFSGPGPIKSSPTSSEGSDEVCVFCHTPHSAAPDAPLWNRSMPVGSYTTYTSDVMAGLAYPVEDPLNQSGGAYAVHVKTRICMSCHDGTIALGTVVNVPPMVANPIPVGGAGTSGGKLTAASAGYLGTDIRDDHPVAVKHQPGVAAGQDPELKAIDTTTKVRVYNVIGGKVRATQNSGDYVECTSCHDAHDNVNGKFLVDDNQFSKLCTACHDKAGDDSSNANETMHSNTTYSTSYPVTGVGSSVQNVKCMVCHYPHRAGVLNYASKNTPNPGAGKYNLTYQEEESCYNATNRWGDGVTTCHGSGMTQNIQSLVTVGSAHRVGNYSTTGGKPHNATEGRSVSPAGNGWLGAAGNSWHVECTDCHNPHTAGRLTAGTTPMRSIGTNTVSSTLSIYGAGGAEPGAAGPWSVLPDNAYTWIEPIGTLSISGTGITKEYQICLKCHSSFAWGNAGPSSVATPNLTDQAKEFNPANISYHPVISSASNTWGTYVAPWTNGSQTMYCSDCHGHNTSLLQGPHGSGIAPILKYTALNTYSTVTNGTQDEGAIATSLCVQCHSASVYNTYSVGDNTAGTGFSNTGANVNLHNRHVTLTRTAGSSYAYRCVNCHVKIPHGWYGNGRKAMVVSVGDPETGTYAPAGGPLITSAPLANSGGYATGDANKNNNCTTAAGCH